MCEFYVQLRHIIHMKYKFLISNEATQRLCKYFFIANMSHSLSLSLWPLASHSCTRDFHQTRKCYGNGTVQYTCCIRFFSSALVWLAFINLFSLLLFQSHGPDLCLLWKKHKVNRCLARYSPRATTTNQPTNRAPNKPAWPGPNWPKMPILGQIGSFLGKNPFFYWRNQKFCYPHNGKPT